MNTNTYTDATDTYIQYQWIVSVLSGLQSDLNRSDEDEGDISISLIKKSKNKSYVTMSTDERDIKVEWDGTKLSATAFNNETSDTESIEVPDAISAILEMMEEVFDITNTEHQAPEEPSSVIGLTSIATDDSGDEDDGEDTGEEEDVSPPTDDNQYDEE